MPAEVAGIYWRGIRELHQKIFHNAHYQSFGIGSEKERPSLPLPEGERPACRKSAAPEPEERISTLAVSVKTGRSAALCTPRHASFFLSARAMLASEAVASMPSPLAASSLFGLVSPFLVPSLQSRLYGVMGIGQKPAKRGTGRFF